MSMKRISQIVDQPLIGPDVEISGIATDSRKLVAGELFCAMKGDAVDGHDFIDQAVAAGAAALAVESESYATSQRLTCVADKDLKKNLGGMAARFYDHPADDMRVVGVTGTNGKTSITHYIAALLDQLGPGCGVIGTLGIFYNDKILSATHTTPDAVSLQKHLYEMHRKNVKCVAMEVSSHALEQYRCNGVSFSGAVFSNITRDHLDYHGSEKAYFNAKARLFQWPGLEWAVLNRDDPASGKLQALIAPGVKQLSYSLDDGLADLSVADLFHDVGGYQGQLLYHGESYPFELAVHGRFNLANALAAFAAVIAMGYEAGDVIAASEAIQPVAGRMQPVANQRGVIALVDYAHTPDALENVLQTVRGMAHRRKLILVFGCGGDRDPGKRAQMAQVAERYADDIIVTTDNPRSEPQADITRDICRGFSDSCQFRVIEDRRAAINHAVATAKRGDFVIVTGKGHETSQIIGDKEFAFDDAKELEKALTAGGELS